MMPTCYSVYHLNLPKPIRSWFPGHSVPPFVVTVGRAASLLGRVEPGVCVGPWEVAVPSPALEPTTPLSSPFPTQLTQSLLWTSSGHASFPAPRPPGTSPERTHAVLCFLHPGHGQGWRQATTLGRRVVTALEPAEGSGRTRAEVTSISRLGIIPAFLRWLRWLRWSTWLSATG